MSPNQTLRKVLRHEAKLAARVEEVFPLLCPVREYEWVDGWTCQLLYSRSGLAEKGAVFTTGFRPEGPSIWTVSRYEPPRAIEFVVVFPGSHVMTIEIVLEPAAAEQTGLTWTCTLTSLVESNAFVEAADQESFDRRQASYDRALEHYCRTGQMLRRDAGILAHHR